jgi:hypothetical protein
MVDKEQIRFLYHLQGVRELFDEYADTFDDELVNGLRYDVPNLLRKQIPPGALFKRCLDLGCGTGLSGVAFRDCCGTYVHLARLVAHRSRLARDDNNNSIMMLYHTFA